MKQRGNPYTYDGWWYWLDEQRGNHGPYATEHEALLDLLRAVAKVPWYKKLWRAFWYS